MKYVISVTGEPFQFSLGKNALYSFDVKEPTAISDAHYQAIVERLGEKCLKIVDEPEQKLAPAQEAPVGETKEGEE